jgi:hypothetical protein
MGHLRSNLPRRRISVYHRGYGGSVPVVVKKRGRPSGSVNRVPGKPRPGARRDLAAFVDNSGPSRFFKRMVQDLEADLGGRRYLSRIEGELIRGFCGAATLLQHQNVQIALGETTEIDPQAYATLASTLLRIGSRLGLQRRARDVTPDPLQYAREQSDEHH